MKKDQAFLGQLVESVASVLKTIQANTRTEDLLKQSQSLAHELQSRQQELQKTNAQLQENARLLTEQNSEAERKTAEAEEARQAVEEKAKQLALASKRKTEFLAHMSHELRSPLNSLLILVDQLAQNAERNLTPRQVEFVQTIHASGHALLNLINDILDLSRIESGTASVHSSTLRFAELESSIERSFRHIAEARGLAFRIVLDRSLPATLVTDAQRLEQVLRNLLSNAFKFTERGEVLLRIAPVTSGWSPDHESLNQANAVIGFSVIDTGIGLAPEKQRTVFEPFQRGDETTNRRYGGTGLGLAISRELARLLGGEIRLTSVLGQGSTFTLYLPQAHMRVLTPRKETNLRCDAPPAMPEIPGWLSTSIEKITEPVADDRSELKADDKVLLLIENDPVYARTLVDLARENGFKAVLAQRADAALAQVRDLKPAAVALDVHLPDLDGWRLLHRLKLDLSTRHIPVHVLSVDDPPLPELRFGAVGFLKKPQTADGLRTALQKLKAYVERPVKKLLLIQNDREETTQICDLLGNGDLLTTAVRTAAEALAAIQIEQYDCLVLDLGLPDMQGKELLNQIRSSPHIGSLPVIIYAARDAFGEEASTLEGMAESILLKDAHGPERLLDETALLLHRNVANLPARQRLMLETMHQGALDGKKVLLVDDDVKNIFALTSLLERLNIQVVAAENGQDALQLVCEHHDFDAVLTEMTLPVMDGYSTMRLIRELPGLKDLPIIAVTAKAMKGDREKCLAAGASDYISKPVDAEHFRATLHLWLHR